MSRPPCAHCEAKHPRYDAGSVRHATKRWSPPEYGSGYLNVCDKHYSELDAERQAMVAAIRAKGVRR